MKIAPIDLVQKTFTQGFRGYEPAEVNAFLEQVRDEMEEQLRRSRALEVELAAREKELSAYKERDQSLRDTLIMAQRMSEDIRTNSEKQAELVLIEARLKAEQIEGDARTHREELLREVEDLRSQRTRHLAALRGSLETHRTLLEALESRQREDTQG